MSFSLREISLQLGDISFSPNEISLSPSDISFVLNEISLQLGDISFPFREISLSCSDISLGKYRAVQRTFPKDIMLTNWNGNMCNSIYLPVCFLKAKASRVNMKVTRSQDSM